MHLTGKRSKSFHLGSGWLQNALGTASSYTSKHQIGAPLITTWLNFLYKAQVCKNPLFFSFSAGALPSQYAFTWFTTSAGVSCWPRAAKPPELYSRCSCAQWGWEQQLPLLHNSENPSAHRGQELLLLLSSSPSACYIYQLWALCKWIPVCKTSVTFLRILFISFRKFKKIEEKVKSMLFLYCFKAYFSEKKRHTLPELINNSVPDMLQDPLSMIAEQIVFDL